MNKSYKFIIILGLVSYFVLAVFIACPKVIIEKNEVYISNKDEKFISEKKYYDVKGNISTLTNKQKKDMKDWRAFIVDLSNKNDDFMYINGPRDKKMVALTFDDGPDNKNTEAIIDVLDSKGVKGNFFLVGNFIDKYPTVVKKTFQNGHLTLNHSKTHANLEISNDNKIKDEILSVQKTLKNLNGKEPNMIRLPYGGITEKQVKLYRELGLNLIFWSLDTLDWNTTNSEWIINNVKDNIRQGEIILMHSEKDRGATVKALPQIIDYIKSQGYEIVTLDKLLGIKAYRD